ncbi:hypothetical protein BRC63_06010 [Halobacteriales archaeon QH_10_70_21]|jgi:hypothetical protein|nr:MAG: hypothetical protein BRC63_06010 [Halobacteriales archaeon QH_10_70_21]
MTTDRRTVRTTVLVAVLACGLLCATTAAAQSSGPDYTEEANHTVVLPDTTDHYPGEQNPRNASQQYWFAGEEGLEARGAESGIWVDRVVLTAGWVDYSACERKNVETFGIDRGNNNSGTTVDEEYDTAETTFRDGEVVVEFPDWDDFVGDPPYLAPEDAVVGAYGPSGTDTGCLNVTGEPGWYRVTGYLNGTVADEDCTDRDDPGCEPADKVSVDLQAGSNFVYVCECDNESEAREELGPPPSERTPTPTATATATKTATPTPTEQMDDDGTPAETADDATGTPADGTAGTATTTSGSGAGPGLAGPALLFGLLAAVVATVRDPGA